MRLKSAALFAAGFLFVSFWLHGGAARMTGGGYIGTSGGVGGEPLAVVRGDKTPGLAALTFSQGSTGGTLLVAAGREPWSVTDGGGASESGGPSEL